MQLSRIAIIGCLALSPALWCEEQAPTITIVHGQEPGKTITIDQLPPVVKEAVLKQVASAQIKEIQELAKQGKSVYEVTFGDTEVTFDALGKVLKSKLEKDVGPDDEGEAINTITISGTIVGNGSTVSIRGELDENGRFKEPVVVVDPKPDNQQKDKEDEQEKAPKAVLVE